MPQCAFKNCKNNHRKKSVSDGISYFRFPRDPLHCAIWISTVVKERQEKFYCPKNNSVICSIHFDELDIVGNSQRRRLRKKAVPKYQIVLPSENHTKTAKCEPTVSNLEVQPPYQDVVIKEEHIDKQGIPNSKILPPSDNRMKTVKSEPTVSNLEVQSPYQDVVIKEEPIDKQGIPNSKVESLSTMKTISFSSSSTASVSELISVYEKPRKKVLKSKLNSCRQGILNKSRNNHNLQKVDKRLVKKSNSLKNIVQLLKRKQKLDETVLLDLAENVEKAEVFSDTYVKQKKHLKKPFSEYPPGARKFALTLHFYSPAAYKYVRKMFKTCLPHPHTLFEWYRNEDAEPGFCSETLNKLKEKVKSSGKNVLCSLVADEMSIRRQKIWNGKRYEGLVDMGLGTDDRNEIANQAYVFMLVAINESWKLPLAYFFIDSIKADMKANLIKIALEKCEIIGVNIRSITFDGCKTNIVTMNCLGCDLKDPSNIKSYFKHPSADYDVVVFLDACHMLKLMRNVLEAKKTIHAANGRVIQWKFITDLCNLQEEHDLHLANKLTQRHIHFKNLIMNVKLAVQLLSRSVAKALIFCKDVLKIPAFHNSDSTTEFVDILNDVFDILNTRNVINFKHPLSSKNTKQILSVLNAAREYLLSITINVKTKKTIKLASEVRTVFKNKTVPLINTQSNTGVLGLLVCINSLTFLHTSLVETDILQCSLTYKFSQDHIELFFGNIRSQVVHNNKPNTRQFKAAFKKLLSYLELGSKYTGNGFPLENMPILSGSTSLDKINNSARGHRFDETEEQNLSAALVLNNQNVKKSFMIYETNCNELGETLEENPSLGVVSQIVGYISGFVVSSLVKKLKCEDCKGNLWAKEKLWFHKLIDIRDMGGLIYASTEVFNICIKTERVIRNLLRVSGSRSMKKMYDSNYICVTVLKSYIHKDAFPRSTEHDHKVNLLKSVIESFIAVRLQYICERETAEIKIKSKRQLYNKLNLFKAN